MQEDDKPLQEAQWQKDLFSSEVPDAMTEHLFLGARF